MNLTRLVIIPLVLLLWHPMQSQWVQTNGPLLNTPVNCLVTSGANLFAGTAMVWDGQKWISGIVSRSTDFGTSWTAALSSVQNTSVTCLAVSGPNLFAGTYGGGRAGTGHGVFLSTDNGTVWIQANSGLTDTSVACLCVDGTNLYAGTRNCWSTCGSGSVYRSTDNGTSWAKTSLQASYPKSLVVNGTKLFAGTGYRMFLSTNNGTSWNSVDSSMDVYSLAVSGTSLFAGTYGGGVFRSTNNGASWTSVTNGLPMDQYGQYLGVQCFAVSGTSLFAGTQGGGVFLSTNNGTNWSAANAGLTDTLVYALAVSGTNLFAGTSGGAWRRPLSEMITSVEPTTSALPREFQLQQNYPNPFNPSTTIKFDLPHALQVSLTVYDVLGREVSVLVNERREAGVYEAKLDGSNLASGVYFYRLQAGTYVETKKLLLLK